MRTGIRGVALALASSAAAGVLVWLLHPVLDAGSYMVFLSAVLLVAVLDGMAAALLATTLAIVLLDFFFLAPRYSLAVVAVADVVLLAVFAGLAGVASWLAGRLRQRHASAEAAAREAAALATLFRRDAEQLGDEVDAMHRLRTAPRPPESR